ncbi:MAG: hypothetical protein U5L05_01090 [Rubrivivax sp.]|nr:hypothetical protein [Rubrivivax sp.]
MNLFNKLPGFVRSVLVLTLDLGCSIVRVMKAPAYGADAYPMPDENGAPMTRP